MNANLAMKPTLQWGTKERSYNRSCRIPSVQTKTKTTTIGKQETSQQATSKQQPVNQQRHQRTIFPIFTTYNIAEEKKTGTKMYCNEHVKQCRNATTTSGPIGEWRRTKVHPLACKLKQHVQLNM